MATKYEYYSSGADASHGSYETYICGQTFTPQITHNITSVKLHVKKQGTLTNVTVEIYATSSSLPTGSALCSKAVDGSGWSADDWAWVEWEFSTNPELTAGVVYAIVISGTGYDATDCPLWQYDGSSPTYTRGNFVRNVNDGGWEPFVSGDFYFEEYGDLITIPVDKTYSKKLIAVGTDEVWYESSTGTMEELTDANGDIDTTKPLSIFEGYGKAFIVNGSNLKVADFVNTKLSTADLGALAPTKDLLLTGGTSGAKMYVDYITNLDDNEASLIYGLRITTVSFSSGETVTGTITTTNDVSFVLDAAEVAPPHWYNWTTYGNAAGDDTTYGAMPGKALLGCLYSGRPVLSGNSQEPHQWYMARQFHPWDFVYTSTDEQSAVRGGNADAGEIGDIVVSLIPSKDDYLIFGCATSIWYIVGDPMSGGSLHELSLDTGMFGAQSWCWASDVLYFWGDNGIYKTSIPGTPECISEIRLPKLVKDEAVDATTHRITMGYDRQRKGITICITTLADGTNSNYWLDLRTNGFFPESYPEECGVYSQYYYNAIDPDYRQLLLGCSDGYLRFFDDAAEDDDIGATNEAINSYVTLGPIALADDPVKEGVISRMSFETAEGASQDSNDVVAKLWVSKFARDVIKKLVANTSPNFTKTITASGRRHGDTIRRKIKGRYGGVRLHNTTEGETWAFEQLLISGKPKGKFR